MHQVAAYQALYSADTISMVAHSPAEIAEQLARSQAALKIDLNGDTLSKLSGLALKRAVARVRRTATSQIVFTPCGAADCSLRLQRQWRNERANYLYPP